MPLDGALSANLIYIALPMLFNFAMNPFCVFIDKFYNFVTKFLLAITITINGILPIHVKHFRGDMSFQPSCCKGLKKGKKDML